MANAAQAYCWMLATVHFSGIFFAHASCRGLQVKSEPHSKCMYASIYIYTHVQYVCCFSMVYVNAGPMH